MAKNQATLKGVPTYIGPESSREADIRPEQKALTPADAALAIITAKKPEKPAGTFKTADAKEFQPSMSHDAAHGRAINDNPVYFQEGERGTPAGACGDERPTNLVGDMVAGMPRAGERFQDTVVDLGADMATGGEPDWKPNVPGIQAIPGDYHRAVSDWPEEKGSGTVSMNPGNTQGEAK